MSEDTRPANALPFSFDLSSFGQNNRDILFAVGVMLILAMLFVPLPPVMLDFGLALSISLSVLILMVALWIKTPLDFDSFPTILLVVTMLRLALNISSTGTPPARGADSARMGRFAARGREYRCLQAGA